MSLTVVVKVPAEDYAERTGSYTLAVDLIAAHGGVRTGGGTCLLTGVSDIDAEVPADRAEALAAALAALGLGCRVYPADEED